MSKLMAVLSHFRILISSTQGTKTVILPKKPPSTKKMSIDIVMEEISLAGVGKIEFE